MKIRRHTLSEPICSTRTLEIQITNTTFARPCSSYLPPSTRVIGASANTEPCPSIFIVPLAVPICFLFLFSLFETFDCYAMQ